MPSTSSSPQNLTNLRKKLPGEGCLPILVINRPVHNNNPQSIRQLNHPINSLINMTIHIPDHHRAVPTEVPDLLSFDSWGSDNLAALSSTTTSSANSSLAGDEAPNICVSISGVIFSLDMTTFDKLRQLPWQKEEGSRDDAEAVSYSLSTSPELFDALVHHILFGALPHAMSKHDMEELEIMALSLGLSSLAHHVSLAQPLPRRRKSQKQPPPPPLPKSSQGSTLRSWAAVKQWSSTGRLKVKNKLMEKKKMARATSQPQRPETRVCSDTTALV